MLVVERKFQKGTPERASYDELWQYYLDGGTPEGAVRDLPGIDLDLARRAREHLENSAIKRPWNIVLRIPDYGGEDE
jgi:hypothetical protein